MKKFNKTYISLLESNEDIFVYTDDMLKKYHRIDLDGEKGDYVKDIYGFIEHSKWKDKGVKVVVRPYPNIEPIKNKHTIHWAMHNHKEPAYFILLPSNMYEKRQFRAELLYFLEKSGEISEQKNLQPKFTIYGYHPGAFNDIGGIVNYPPPSADRIKAYRAKKEYNLQGKTAEHFADIMGGIND